MPATAKRFAASLDYDEKRGVGFSISGFLSLVSLIGLALIKMQRFGFQKDIQSKMTESRIEREFRHRNLFTIDMHIHLMVMISAILCSFCFILKLVRQKAECLQYIKETKKVCNPDAKAAAGKQPQDSNSAPKDIDAAPQKDKVDKKND